MRKKIWMQNFRIEYIFRSDRWLLFSGMNMPVRTTALISSTGRQKKQSKPFLFFSSWKADHWLIISLWSQNVWLFWCKLCLRHSRDTSLPCLVRDKGVCYFALTMAQFEMTLASICVSQTMESSLYMHAWRPSVFLDAGALLFSSQAQAIFITCVSFISLMLKLCANRICTRLSILY